MLHVSFELIDLSALMLLHSILSCCITGQTLHVVSFEFIDGPIQTVAPQVPTCIIRRVRRFFMACTLGEKPSLREM